MKKQKKIVNLMHVKVLLCAACAALSLAGCSVAPEQTEQQEQANSSSEDLENIAFPDLKLCTDYNENGFFSIWNLNTSYSTIFFTDFEEKKQIVFCNVPNCTHDSDSCRSYIGLENGDFAPTILTMQNKILLIYAAQSTGKMAQIQMMDMNGDNRQVLVELQQGEMLRGGIYTDETYIYFDKWSTVQTENGPVDQGIICRVNMESGECEQIYTVPSGSSIWGIAGSGYLLYSYNSDENKEEYYRLSPTEDSHEWQLSDSPVYQNDANESGSFALGGCIIDYSVQKAFLKVTELESGKCTEIDCTDQFPAYDPEWVPNITNAYGGSTSAHYLLMENPILDENEGTRRPEYKLIDTTTGEFSQPVTLTEDTGRPLLVSGEYGDYFFVITGFDSVNTSATSDSGDYLVSSYDIPRYALISKSDYFSQTENLIPIENVF